MKKRIDPDGVYLIGSKTAINPFVELLEQLEIAFVHIDPGIAPGVEIHLKGKRSIVLTNSVILYFKKRVFLTREKFLTFLLKTKKTKVVNLRKEPYDVYIGRAGRGKDGYFGNPFGSGTREENIERFRMYFLNKVKTNPVFKKEVLKLKGKVLGCFCKPKACHGDVIADWLDNNANRKKR